MKTAATPEAMMTAVDLEQPPAPFADFDSVVRLHWPAVFRFILASVRDRDAAESLTQDCFLRAHRASGRFRGDCSVHTWLMQIAVNLVRDRARNRRLQFWNRARATAVDFDAASNWIPDEDLSPEARLLAREQVEAVWKAAGHLSERQRTVFLLRFVEEMQILEIAAATGMREGTVKVHLFRALEAVRNQLRRHV
jgi:RNA polymerase sigma-70 factor (ECF subfamily)